VLDASGDELQSLHIKSIEKSPSGAGIVTLLPGTKPNL